MKNLSKYILYGLLIWGVIVFLLSVIWDVYQPMLTTMYIFCGICIVVALIAAVLGMLNKPGNIKSSAIGLGALLLVCVLAYVLAGDEVMKGQEITATVSKMVGAGLYMFYILLVGAIAAIAYSAVSKMLK